MENNLQKRINDVAQALKSQGQVFTRSDLAYQLADEGAKDNLDLEREVYLSQQKYRFPEHLFVTNDYKISLVEDYRLRAALLATESNRVESIVSGHLQQSKSSINETKKAIEAAVADFVVNVEGGLMNRVTGTHGIEKVRAEATELYNRYEMMVEMYDHAKDSVNLSIEDFALVRSDVQNQFLHYATALTDVFGDSVKVIDPDLFDFNQIEWLDVCGMQKQMQLEFTTITSKCGELMSMISDKFRQSLDEASNTYQRSDDKRFGLILGGLSLVSHYMDAHQQTGEMKGELMRFEKSMARDKALISGDILRLGTIYKTLNDVAIPKALAFRRYSEHLLQNGLQQLIDSLYSSDEAKALREEREQVLQKLKKTDGDLQDLQDHINYYSSSISENKQLLDEMRPQYNNARQSMPHKPFFLFNILTLGSLGRTYQKEMLEWSQTCMPLVQTYEDMETEVKIDTEDLEKYQQELKKCSKEYGHLKLQLSDYNKKLMHLVNADEKTKLRMLSSLKDVLRLLVLAKEITQTRLDDNLTKVVRIRDFQDVKLPAEINNGLTTFIDSLQDKIQMTPDNARQLMDGIITPQQNEDGSIKDYSEEDVQALTDMSNEVLQKGVEIGRQMIDLMQQRVDTEAAKRHYDNEFRRLKDEFVAQVALLDERRDALLMIMSELSNSNDGDSIKEALFKLSDGKLDIPTDDELQEFLRGNRKIEI